MGLGLNFNPQMRAQVFIPAGFGVKSKEVKRILLEAAGKVPRILEEPKPYVRITNFQRLKE